MRKKKKGGKLDSIENLRHTWMSHGQVFSYMYNDKRSYFHILKKKKNGTFRLGISVHRAPLKCSSYREKENM